MSPQSSTINAQPYMHYWKMLAKKLGAIVSGMFLSDGTLFLRIGSDERAFTIILAPTKNGSCWVVKDFVTAKEAAGQKEKGVLSGNELLAHYDKRLAQHPNDFIHPGEKIWTIRRPADLAALLESYDKLAREWGLTVIFGH